MELKVILFAPDVPSDFFFGEGITAIDGGVAVDSQALGKHLCCLSFFYLHRRCKILLHII